MKAKVSSIKRRVAAIVGAIVSTFLAGGPPAFAYRLDDDSITRPVPAAPPVQADAAGSGGSWVIPLIVALALLAVAAALIGTVRIYRARGRTVVASA